MKQPRNIIISRTDSIGDVVLTLPMAKALKDLFPGVYIAFMGKAYTKAVIEACEHIDAFIDVNDFLKKDIRLQNETPECIIHVFPVSAIAKRAKALNIPVRIGTTNRWYHWVTCNRFVKLSRKKSDLHEAQLNLKLLSAFGVHQTYSLAEIAGMYRLTRLQPLAPEFAQLINPRKYNLILHPKSQGSAREWGLDHFISLAESLDLSQYKIFVSGTVNERAALLPLLDKAKESITDITGIMSLPQFISFINHCDGLVACSTGPLHIAAALGKDAYGIYAPIRPMHAGRWSPVGSGANVFEKAICCHDCRNDAAACHCIKEIQPEVVKSVVETNKNRLFDRRKHF